MKKIASFVLALLLVTATVFAAPNPGGGNSGAIWTTKADCGDETQDANHYMIGEQIHINGKNFDPGLYNWEIKGQPGNASCDPGIVVANGTVTVGANGSFCFDAYAVANDDCGEYSVKVGTKGDNYRVVDLAEPLVEVSDLTIDSRWPETVTWSITKTATPDKIHGSGQSLYTVAVEQARNGLPPVIFGEYTIKNGGDEGVEVLPVTITLKKGGVVVDEQFFNHSAGPGSEVRYGFNFVLASPEEGGVYVVEVKAVISTGISANAQVVLVKNLTGYPAIHVVDSNGMSWDFSGSGSVSYARQFVCEADAGSHTNVATITETGQSASAKVEVICEQRKFLEVKTNCIDPFVYKPTMRVHFVVTNPNAMPVEIAHGLNNALDPIGYQGMQPTLFAPGETEWEVEIGRYEVLQWLLDGSIASASMKTNICTYATQDDVYIAGVGVFYDTNRNGQFDAGESLLAPDFEGKIGEVYMVDANGKTVDSRVLRAETFSRAGREVNFGMRQIWGEYYLVPQLSVPMPAGYRIYPNYRLIHTPEFPEPFYSMNNDFGLVPADFVADPLTNLDLPHLAALDWYLINPVKPGVAKTASEEVRFATVPTAFVLNQNYPNPFNPQTTISYDLPEQTQVTLTVYDVTGKVVATLVDGWQEAGSYVQVWSAAQNSSGIYLCELRAGTFRQMRRMLLVK